MYPSDKVPPSGTGSRQANAPHSPTSRSAASSERWSSPSTSTGPEPFAKTTSDHILEKDRSPRGQRPAPKRPRPAGTGRGSSAPPVAVPEKGRERERDREHGREHPLSRVLRRTPLAGGCHTSRSTHTQECPPNHTAGAPSRQVFIPPPRKLTVPCVSTRLFSSR